MRDQTENETTGEAEAAVDPYGDVPLGVECAWPQTIALAQATDSDLPS
jgi:hypothetical protein